jgi:phosphomannomutase/phosphoglucomutase
LLWRGSVTKLFGTDGVRGVVNDSLTPELALKVAQAACTWLGGGKVLVARDVRYGGDMLVNAVSAGLLSCGCEVHYSGLAPTPALQYAVPRLGYDMGIMITASHNPPPYMG